MKKTKIQVIGGRGSFVTVHVVVRQNVFSDFKNKHFHILKKGYHVSFHIHYKQKKQISTPTTAST